MDQDDRRTVTKLRVPQTGAVDRSDAASLRLGQPRCRRQTQPQVLRAGGPRDSKRSEHQEDNKKAAHFVYGACGAQHVAVLHHRKQVTYLPQVHAGILPLRTIAKKHIGIKKYRWTGMSARAIREARRRR